MFLFNKTKKNKIIAVLEISSASASGAFVSVSKDGAIPKIISSALVPSNFLLDVDFQAFWRCSKESLKKVMEQLLKDYPAGPDTAMCVFHSPWFTSQIKIIDVKREKSFVVTKDFFDNLIKTEEKNFRTEWTSRFASLESKPEFIERELMKTELNGYYVELPVKKEAKTVRSNIYMSLGVKEVREGIEKLVLENFGNVPLLLKTFPLVAFNVLSGIFNIKDGFIFVCVGDEMTDISLVRNHSLEESISFPRGVNTVLRKIAAEFNTFPQEALSTLKTYLKEHKAEKQAEKISEIVQETEAEWCEFLEKALKCISENSPLPQNLFIAGDDIISPRFIKCAEVNTALSQLTILGKPFDIKKFLSDSLAYYLDFKNNTKEEVKTCLLLECLYASKILKN